MRTLAKLLERTPGGPADLRFFWEQWPPEKKRAVVARLLERGRSDSVERILAGVASTHRFRESFVRRASQDKKAEWTLFALRRGQTPDLLLDVVLSYLSSAERELAEGFLDRLGVPHEHGMPTGEDSQQAPTVAMLRETVQWARESFAPDAVVLLLAAHACLWSWMRRTLPEVVREFVAGDRASEIAVTGDAATEDVDALREPEDSEAFTTLDNLTIKTIVASLLNVEGALPPDALDDFVTELVELNADRHRSFFHRGFLDALRKRPFQWTFQGQNARRQEWYWCGVVMGLTRLSDPDGVVTVFDEQRGLATAVTRRVGEGGVMVGPHVFRALLEAGRLGEGLEVLEGVLPRLDFGVAHELLARGAAWLREGRIAEAAQVLEFLHRNVPALEERWEPEGLPPAFTERLLRKRAQCVQLQGNLVQAREMLDELLDGDAPAELASVLADRGLVEGGFRSLAEVRFPREASGEALLRGALERGEEWFDRAVRDDSAFAANATYCLGFLSTLRCQAKEARRYLSMAVAMMSRRVVDYSVGGLLAQAEFLLGLAMLEEVDPGVAHQATRHLSNAASRGLAAPSRWWARAATAAAMHGDEMLELFGTMIPSGIAAELVPEARQTRELLRLEQVREALRAEAARTDRGVQERWRDWVLLLDHFIVLGPSSQAEEALDVLEGLAQHRREREQLLAILADRARYSPVWSDEDATWVRVRLLEAEGRYEEAASLLVGLFHPTVREADERGIEEAREIVQRIISYGRPGYDVGELQHRLEGAESRLPLGTQGDQGLDALRQGAAHVRVTFVGGTELEAGHDEVLRNGLKREFPGLSVEFFHPNMSSNWGLQLGDIRGRLGASDAVVIARTVRTGMGAKLRRECNLWVPCSGRGREAVKRSILTAARVALAQR